MRRRRRETRCTPDEPLVHDSHLEKVLRQRARLEIIVVRLADPAQETHRSGPAEVKLEHTEHEALRFQNLLGRVAAVDHVLNLLDGRAVDLLVLGRDEDGGCADELQLAEGDDLAGEEAIDVVDGEEEGFGEETEAVVHLDEPVHQDGAHRPLNLDLVVHVVWVGA